MPTIPGDHDESVFADDPYLASLRRLILASSSSEPGRRRWDSEGDDDYDDDYDEDEDDFDEDDDYDDEDDDRY